MASVKSELCYQSDPSRFALAATQECALETFLRRLISMGVSLSLGHVPATHASFVQRPVSCSKKCFPATLGHAVLSSGGPLSRHTGRQPWKWLEACRPVQCRCIPRTVTRRRYQARLRRCLHVQVRRTWLPGRYGRRPARVWPRESRAEQTAVRRQSSRS